jgi:hypothetical protein
MRLRLALLVSGCCVALAAHAAAPSTEPAEPPGIARFHAFSEGATTCDDVVAAIEDERAHRPPGMDYQASAWQTPYMKLVFWMDGYLSARNEQDPDHRMVGRSLGIESRMRWIEGYCRASPFEVFIHAVGAMREQMIEESR